MESNTSAEEQGLLIAYDWHECLKVLHQHNVEAAPIIPSDKATGLLARSTDDG
jgi:hypothetical protein